MDLYDEIVNLSIFFKASVFGWTLDIIKCYIKSISEKKDTKSQPFQFVMFQKLPSLDHKTSS